MMTRKEKMKELGKLGENTFKEFIIKKYNVPVYHNFDEFDNTKDMVIWGKRFEIKTQVPFLSRHGFAVREDQMEKILNVSRVIFISVPPPDDPKYKQLVEQNYHLVGNIYTMNMEEKNSKYYSHTTKDGRKMVVFPIDQKAINFLHKITDLTILSKMKELSVSEA